MVNIKLLVTIVNYDNENKIKRIYNKYKIPFDFVANGFGTAPKSILDSIGITETKKSIFLTIIPHYLEDDILFSLHEEYKIFTPGKGIGFVVPIASSNKYLSVETAKISKNKEDIIVEQVNKYHLVITVVNEGFGEKVVDIAKKGKYGGATLINGRTLGTKEKSKFLGISIEPEKDIVLMLVKSDKKNTLMESITKKVGLLNEARGICFSIPTDSVIGLDENIIFTKE